MKIISDLPNYIISRIRKLVAEERYNSISEFILTATENQLALEFLETNDVLDLSHNKSINSIQQFNSEYHILKSEIPVLELIPIQEGKDIWDRWIWGQINRILPIKFAARLLAIESSKTGSFPEKKVFNEAVSKEARKFGLYLKKQDSRLKKARDKNLSAGFPVGEKIESSLSRYWSQFVGYQKKDGALTGALFDLALANLFNDDDGTLRIGLNTEGKKFAQLQNPVLDNHNFTHSLSETEITFYLEHIKANVPGEVSLFSILLGLLNRGVERREEMNKELSKHVKGSGWSDGLISTQRSGAFSRMYELGLLSKDRIGLEVRYHITERGKKWFRNSK